MHLFFDQTNRYEDSTVVNQQPESILVSKTEPQISVENGPNVYPKRDHQRNGAMGSRTSSNSMGDWGDWGYFPVNHAFPHFLMFQVGTSNFMFVKTARFRGSAAPPSTTHGGRCQSTCLTQQVRPPHFVMFCLTMNFLVSFFGKQDITSTQ